VRTRCGEILLLLAGPITGIAGARTTCRVGHEQAVDDIEYARRLRVYLSRLCCCSFCDTNFAAREKSVRPRVLHRPGGELQNACFIDAISIINELPAMPGRSPAGRQ
jgi:hypothetical protein